MHICPISMAIDSSFGPIFSIVAKPFEDFPQWFGGAEIGTTTVILKTDKCTPIPTNRHISNTARYPWSFVNSPGIENAQPFHVGSMRGTIILRQQLKAPTNCQN